MVDVFVQNAMNGRNLQVSASTFMPSQGKLACGRTDGSIILVPAVETIVLHLLDGGQELGLFLATLHLLWTVIIGRTTTLLLLLDPFNSLLSRTTWVSRYEKGKTSLDLNEARDDGVWGWQWHQLDHMQTVCGSLHTDNHTSPPSLNIYRPEHL